MNCSTRIVAYLRSAGFAGALVFALVAATSAHAAFTTAVGLKVVDVSIYPEGYGSITFESDLVYFRGATDRCLPNNEYNTNRRVGFDLKTEGGRALFSAALAAKLSGKKLLVETSDVCHPGMGVNMASWSNFSD